MSQIIPLASKYLFVRGKPKPPPYSRYISAKPADPQAATLACIRRLMRNDLDMQSCNRWGAIGLICGMGATEYIFINPDTVRAAPVYLNPVLLSGLVGYIACVALSLIGNHIQRDSDRVQREIVKLTGKRHIPLVRAANVDKKLIQKLTRLKA